MRLASLLLALASSTSGFSQARVWVNDHQPRPLDEKLYAAVRDGKVEGVRALLAKGANPNAALGYADAFLAELGGTPAQQLAIAKLLVAKGARINGNPGDQNFTPLTHTFYGTMENAPLVRYLLRKGANPNAAVGFRRPPLDQAIGVGYVASARLLIAYGARLDARTNDAEVVRPDKPGLEPYERRDIEKRVMQMNHTFEPGYRDAGQTLVFGLAARWSPAMADLLLRAGASLKTTDINGWTPLHLAAKWGNVPAVAGIIARGADPNAASKGGFRPLHLALRAGYGFPDANTVRALLARGADPKLKNRAGQTPLDLLRADAEWRVGNPSKDPELAFPPAYLASYQAMVDAAAKALAPGAVPIILALPKPDPKGETYAPLEVFGGLAQRTVRVENDEAILELRFPPLARGSATLTVKEIALEEYDTLTPLPMVVKRVAGVPSLLRFHFPEGAARGGDVNMAADQHGPDQEGGSMGQPNIKGDTDRTHPQPSFWFIEGVAVAHQVPDRTMEFEIVSATRAGKPVSALVGKRLLVPSDSQIKIPDLKAASPDDKKTRKTKLVFRFRYLPNVRWLRGSIDL